MSRLAAVIIWILGSIALVCASIPWGFVESPVPASPAKAPCGMPCCAKPIKVSCCPEKAPEPMVDGCGCTVESGSPVKAQAPTAVVGASFEMPVCLPLVVDSPPVQSQVWAEPPHLVVPRIRAPEPGGHPLRAPPAL